MKAPPVVALQVILFLSAPLAFAEPDGVVPSRIKRTPVVSSNVASIGYGRHLHALEIEFLRGAVYRFLNVPAGVYRDLLASESKGRFIAEHLRGKYEFVRVRPRRSDARAAGQVAARSP